MTIGFGLLALSGVWLMELDLNIGPRDLLLNSTVQGLATGVVWVPLSVMAFWASTLPATRTSLPTPTVRPLAAPPAAGAEGLHLAQVVSANNQAASIHSPARSRCLRSIKSTCVEKTALPASTE